MPMIKIKNLRALKKFHLDNIRKCENFLASVTPQTKKSLCDNIKKALIQNIKQFVFVGKKINLVKFKKKKNAKLIRRRF